jgi:hypothetical protein
MKKMAEIESIAPESARATMALWNLGYANESSACNSSRSAETLDARELPSAAKAGLILRHLAARPVSRALSNQATGGTFEPRF